VGIPNSDGECPVAEFCLVCRVVMRRVFTRLLIHDSTLDLLDIEYHSIQSECQLYRGCATRCQSSCVTVIPSHLWNDVAKERQLPTIWVNVAYKFYTNQPNHSPCGPCRVQLLSEAIEQVGLFTP